MSLFRQLSSFQGFPEIRKSPTQSAALNLVILLQPPTAESYVGHAVRKHMQKQNMDGLAILGR